jgi:hypothetical protein
MTLSQAIRITKLMPSRYEIAYLRIETIDFYQPRPGQIRKRMPDKPTYQPKEPHERRTNIPSIQSPR